MSDGRAEARSGVRAGRSEALATRLRDGRWHIGLVSALAVIAAAAMCLMVVAVTTGAGRWGSFWPAMAALVAVAAATAMQRAVVVRRRPALSDDLRRADDVMRRLAATQGFTRPAIAFALVMLSQGLATFGNSTTVTVAVLALWMLAIAWYAASRQSRANLRALIGS